MVMDSLVTPSSGVVNPVLKGALKVRERLCRAPKSHALANVVATLSTPLALAARHTDFHSDLVSDLEIRDF